MEKSFYTPKILSLVICIIGAVLGIVQIVSGAMSFGTNVTEVTILAICYIAFGAIIVIASGVGLIGYKKFSDAGVAETSFIVAAVLCIAEAVVNCLTAVALVYLYPEAGTILLPFTIILGVAFGVPAILYLVAFGLLKAGKSFKGVGLTASVILLVLGAVNLFILIIGGGSGTSWITYALVTVLIFFAGFMFDICRKSEYREVSSDK